ncbi:hypothetical protein MGN70_008103 [Eutypa lata]|nr:hypothetical protein MGN70_008103 [Eutypa lata]
MTDHLARLSSGSADASTLDATKATEMPNSFTSSQDLAGLEQINGNLPFPSGRAQADYHKIPQIPPNLFHWYRDVNGPWTGLATQVDTEPSSTVGNLRTNSHIFQFRENVVPSECSTILPSDSGYGSYGAKHSVTNNSVCDETYERSTETQSVVGHMNDLTFPNFDPEILSSQGNSWQLSQGGSKFGDHSSQPNTPSIICNTCNKVLKTNSELKKHTQRHTKPYRCDVPHCTRREGFSTSNDLDRHKRSVHPDTAAAGNRYTCPMPSCKSRGKIWPRADNFRAHLKRVHQNDVPDDELEKYVVTPPPAPSAPPAVISDLARENINTSFPHFSSFPSGSNNVPGSYWQLPQSEIAELSNEPSPTEKLIGNTSENDTLTLEDTSQNTPPLPRSDSRVPSTYPQNTSLSLDSLKKTVEEATSREFQAEGHQSESLSEGSTLLSGVGALQPEDQERRLSPSRHEIEDGQTESPDESNDLSVGADSPELVKELKEVDCDPLDSSESDSQQNVKSGLRSFDLTDQTEVGRLLETLQSNGLLRKLGYKKESSVQPDIKALAEITTNSNQEHLHPCSECGKTFSRRCELRCVHYLFLSTIT